MVELSMSRDGDSPPRADKRPLLPSYTERTCSVSGSIVTTAVTPVASATSRGLPATSTPPGRPASRALLTTVPTAAALWSCTSTSKPARERLRAMGRPMAPSPIKPTFPSARATLTSGGASWCRSPLLGTVAAAPAPTHDSWRNLGSSATTRACAVPATSAAGAVAARTAGVRRSVSAAAAVAARGSIAPRLLSTALARSASFNGALPLLTRTCVPSTPARSH
mmetsp:Transcript_16118/g.47884  ORF Transcript_16118/g.47884 Transcript_16118/m.47884 type:complete len:223 (+) Transcript_16118:621-1289(+)